MQVVDFPHAAPSVCFNCESAHAGVPCVDTGRFFEPPGITHLNGRKYLCLHCVAEAAHVLDVFADKRAAFEEELHALRQVHEHVSTELSAVKKLMDAVEELKPFLPPRAESVEPKPPVRRGRPPKAAAGESEQADA